MKNTGIALLVVCAVIFFSFKEKKLCVGINEIKVKAPYGLVNIKVPDFSKCTRINIADLGAVAGDKVKTSQAIANAIDKANKAGGGVVVIPEGEWLTGKIHLKSLLIYLL